MSGGWVAFGIIATVIGLVRGVPQLWLLRSRDAHGVSIDTAAASAAVSGGWTAYGLFTGQYAVVTASGSSAMVFAAIFVVAHSRAASSRNEALGANTLAAVSSGCSITTVLQPLFGTTARGRFPTAAERQAEIARLLRHATAPT
jgi:hypothetical protein